MALVDVTEMALVEKAQIIFHIQNFRANFHFRGNIL
jgi:hypothetical protein